jgi:hypothetical protein
MKTNQKIALLILALAIIGTSFGQGTTALTSTTAVSAGKQSGNTLQESKSIAAPEINKTNPSTAEVKKPVLQSNNAKALEIARAEIKASEEAKEKETKQPANKEALKPEVPTANPAVSSNTPVSTKEAPKTNKTAAPVANVKTEKVKPVVKTTPVKTEKATIGKKPKAKASHHSATKTKAKPAAKKKPVKKEIDKIKKKIAKKKAAKKATAKKKPSKKSASKKK